MWNIFILNRTVSEVFPKNVTLHLSSKMSARTHPPPKVGNLYFSSRLLHKQHISKSLLPHLLLGKTTYKLYYKNVCKIFQLWTSWRLHYKLTTKALELTQKNDERPTKPWVYYLWGFVFTKVFIWIAICFLLWILWKIPVHMEWLMFVSISISLRELSMQNIIIKKTLPLPLLEVIKILNLNFEGYCILYSIPQNFRNTIQCTVFRKFSSYIR